MASDQTVVEPVDSRRWLARWRWIITASIVLILFSYLAAGFWAATLLADFPWFRPPDSFMFNSALRGLLAIALTHWVGNVFLSIEKDLRPVRWWRLLPYAIWFLLVPLIPVFGVMRESEPWAYATPPGAALPSVTPELGYYAILLCPLVTFLRLRKLAMQVGQVRLGRLAAIVAIGDVVSLSAGCALQAVNFNPMRNIQSFPGAVAFLLPQVVLIFFALGSLYVLFEMAGHFFNLARPQRDQNESWFGPRPVRT